MSVTGIDNNMNSIYTTAPATAEKAEDRKPTENDKVTGNTAPDAGKTESKPAAVYDKSKLSEEDRKSIVAQLKADQEKRQSQLTDLVHDMLSKQTNAFGKANNIWSFLAKGDLVVDAETRKKAQEDISEDGYWGVKQTSDRIVSFATALAGDDPDKLEEMRAAFEKGFKKAEKTWGGKLPEISQKTYDAVQEKFDKLMEARKEQEGNKTVNTTEDGTVIEKQ